MSSNDPLKEAERILGICNACRYCEGFCAVFPAMERRRTFSDKDLKYMANLCHNCRDCYYACQFAPPHEYDLNVPRTLAELRLETYQEFSWPVFFVKLFRNNGLKISLITGSAIVIILLLVLGAKGTAVFFGTHIGEGAFFKIIPYLFIVLPFSLMGFYILATLLIGVARFWRETGGHSSEFFDLRAHFQAIKDALVLRYLDGGGHGCNYPDDRFSMIRRWLHHFVFYGFILCFCSTTVAAFYDHFLQRVAPYPIWSWPVILGTAGGVALLIGTGGLLLYKVQMDRSPATARALSMDVVFLVLLFLTSMTGLLLLILRETSALGILLVVHLGVVVGLFVTIPYGKFVHAIYRYTALVKNAVEQSREEV